MKSEGARTSAAGAVVGLDLGGTNIIGGILDGEGRTLATGKKKVGPDPDPGTIVRRMEALTREICDRAGLGLRDLVAVGVGAPGPVHPREGLVLRAPNLGWREVPLARLLRDLMGVPCLVENDVNVGTYAEWRMGAGKGASDLIGIFVGTGIGAGIVLDGRLYHGSSWTAGEIGHCWIHADAPIGRRTLEQCASRGALGFWLQQAIAQGRPSILPEIVPDGDLRQIRSKAIAKAWAREDPLVVEVVGHAARYIGIAAANAVTLLSLSRVVLGGGVVEALGDSFVALVRESFEMAVFPEDLRKCPVSAGALGDDAGWIGAAMLAHEHLGLSRP